MRGRGSGPLPRFKPCKLPRRLVLNSSVDGRQASSIKERMGPSWPERPGAEIKDFKNGTNSVMG
jgi:hypothetical protein